jgi:histidinol phosphatase-like enzyme (inositol monophosphatase family)
MTASVPSYLDFALDAAWQAGRITLGYFQAGVAVEHKSDNSPVTIADRSAEQKLRDLIQHSWPDHGIVGEEYGETVGTSGYTWIVDPIDGTKSFVRGVPLYGVLIALTYEHLPIVGVAHFPALNETVYAAREVGCFWDGRRAYVSKVNDLSHATLLSSEVAIKQDEQKIKGFQRLVEATDVQRTWGDAYGYALVATGRAEIMLDAKMAVWDCGPLQVILEEAGGTFTDWKGTATIYGNDSIATNGLLFDQVMSLVQTQA